MYNVGSKLLNGIKSMLTLACVRVKRGEVRVSIDNDERQGCIMSP